MCVCLLQEKVIVWRTVPTLQRSFKTSVSRLLVGRGSKRTQKMYWFRAKPETCSQVVQGKAMEVSSVPASLFRSFRPNLQTTRQVLSSQMWCSLTTMTSFSLYKFQGMIVRLISRRQQLKMKLVFVRLKLATFGMKSSHKLSAGLGERHDCVSSLLTAADEKKKCQRTCSPLSATTGERTDCSTENSASLSPVQ